MSRRARWELILIVLSALVILLGLAAMARGAGGEDTGLRTTQYTAVGGVNAAGEGKLFLSFPSQVGEPDDATKVDGLWTGPALTSGTTTWSDEAETGCTVTNGGELDVLVSSTSLSSRAFFVNFTAPTCSFFVRLTVTAGAVPVTIWDSRSEVTIHAPHVKLSGNLEVVGDLNNTLRQDAGTNLRIDHVGGLEVTGSTNTTIRQDAGADFRTDDVDGTEVYDRSTNTTANAWNNGLEVYNRDTNTTAAAWSNGLEIWDRTNKSYESSPTYRVIDNNRTPQIEVIGSLDYPRVSIDGEQFNLIGNGMSQTGSSLSISFSGTVGCTAVGGPSSASGSGWAYRVQAYTISPGFPGCTGYGVFATATETLLIEFDVARSIYTDEAGGLELYDRSRNLTNYVDLVGGIEVYNRDTNTTAAAWSNGLEVYDRSANVTRTAEINGSLAVSGFNLTATFGNLTVPTNLNATFNGAMEVSGIGADLEPYMFLGLALLALVAGLSRRWELVGLAGLVGLGFFFFPDVATTFGGASFWVLTGAIFLILYWLLALRSRRRQREAVGAL